MQALWEALKSIPRQREALDSGSAGWISNRDMKAYYLTQETSQLMRSAPRMTETRTKVPSPSELVPLKRMQADTISMKGVPSGGYQGIINVIDLFSHYSWQIPIQTVGNAASAAAAVNALVNH